MFRKLTVTAVTAMGLMTPLAATPTAEAHPPFGHFHRHRYEVLYRRCGCPTWECYGSYYFFGQADRTACWLRSRGFEARVCG